MGIKAKLEKFNQEARAAFDDGPVRPHQDCNVIHPEDECALCDQFPSKQLVRNRHAR